MKPVHGHEINPANRKLEITKIDAPGAGGAYHHYIIAGYDIGTNDSRRDVKENLTRILFQNGSIPEVGVNGVTIEALLAVCADRLSDFQKGPFVCRENALALTKIQEALHWLNARTAAREIRGVEGRHEA